MKKVRIIGIIAAIILSLTLYIFLKSVGTKEEAPRSAVVVASMNIPANTAITEDMVRLAEISADAVLPDAMTDVSQAIGSTVNSDVYAGEQLLSERIVEFGNADAGSLSYVVEEGMRAISIDVSTVEGIAGMLKPGNYVDLIAQYQTDTGKTDTSGNPIYEQAARIVLQNVKILAVDRYMSASGAPSDTAYTTLTLSVTPEQALELSFVDNLVSIRAILRSTLDSQTIDEYSITVDDIHIKRG